jgi:hypothetical protein
MGPDVLVHRPAVTDDRCMGFEAVTNKSQGVGACVGNATKEGLDFDATEHPLPLHSWAPIALAPTEPALVDVSREKGQTLATIPPRSTPDICNYCVVELFPKLELLSR